MIIEIEAEYQSDAGTTKRASYGLYFVNICEKTNRVITDGTALYILNRGPDMIFLCETELQLSTSCSII